MEVFYEPSSNEDLLYTFLAHPEQRMTMFNQTSNLHDPESLEQIKRALDQSFNDQRPGCPPGKQALTGEACGHTPTSVQADVEPLQTDEPSLEESEDPGSSTVVESGPKHGAVIQYLTVFDREDDLRASRTGHGFDAIREEIVNYSERNSNTPSTSEQDFAKAAIASKESLAHLHDDSDDQDKEETRSAYAATPRPDLEPEGDPSQPANPHSQPLITSVHQKPTLTISGMKQQKDGTVHFSVQLEHLSSQVQTHALFCFSLNPASKDTALRGNKHVWPSAIRDLCRSIEHGTRNARCDPVTIYSYSTDRKPASPNAECTGILKALQERQLIAFCATVTLTNGSQCRILSCVWICGHAEPLTGFGRPPLRSPVPLAIKLTKHDGYDSFNMSCPSSAAGTTLRDWLDSAAATPSSPASSPAVGLIAPVQPTAALPSPDLLHGRWNRVHALVFHYMEDTLETWNADCAKFLAILSSAVAVVLRGALGATEVGDTHFILFKYCCSENTATAAANIEETQENKLDPFALVHTHRERGGDRAHVCQVRRVPLRGRNALVVLVDPDEGFTAVGCVFAETKKAVVEEVAPLPQRPKRTRRASRKSIAEHDDTEANEVVVETAQRARTAKRKTARKSSGEHSETKLPKPSRKKRLLTAHAAAMEDHDGASEVSGGIVEEGVAGGAVEGAAMETVSAGEEPAKEISQMNPEGPALQHGHAELQGPVDSILHDVDPQDLRLGMERARMRGGILVTDVIDVGDSLLRILAIPLRLFGYNPEHADCMQTCIRCKLESYISSCSADWIGWAGDGDSPVLQAVAEIYRVIITVTDISGELYTFYPHPPPPPPLLPAVTSPGCFDGSDDCSNSMDVDWADLSCSSPPYTSTTTSSPTRDTSTSMELTDTENAPRRILLIRFHPGRYMFVCHNQTVLPYGAIALV